MARKTLLALATFVALTFTSPAHAGGGDYVFDGGGRAARAQVRAALDASAFPWGTVPVQVTIHIEPGVRPHSTVGEIWLDPALLRTGRFSWGIVQHEYAHQVAFFLVDRDERRRLTRLLAGRSWCYDAARRHHDEQACERFASALAWTYWPSRFNTERPTGATGARAAVPPRAFKRVIARLLRAPAARPA